MKYCSQCGAELLDQAVVCPKCGCPVNGAGLVQPQPVQQKRANALDVFSVFAMISGIIMLILGIVGFWFLPLAVVVFIVALIGLTIDIFACIFGKYKGRAIGGIVVNSIAMLCGFLGWAFIAALIAAVV